MGRRLRVPGSRDVRATLDEPEGGDEPMDASGVVVALPPHPQMGGSRSDPRLRAVSAAVTAAGCACCRVDYGPWDRGRGEVTDACNAFAWAGDEYEWVGCFGYSFGAGVALLAASAADRSPDALSVCAPPATIGGDRDVVAALDEVECPLQVVYGENDGTVDWESVVERARERGDSVESLPTGHFFPGRADEVADLVARFFRSLGP